MKRKHRVGAREIVERSIEIRTNEQMATLRNIKIFLIISHWFVGIKEYFFCTAQKKIVINKYFL